MFQTAFTFKLSRINFIQIISIRNLSLPYEGATYDDQSTKSGNYNFLRISFWDNKIAQFIYGTGSDGSNDKDLTDEGVDVRISGRNIKSNWFSISKEFRLPRAYKTASFQIIIEEYERVPARIPKLDNFYKDRME